MLIQVACINTFTSFNSLDIMMTTITLSKDQFLSLHFIETFFPNESFGESTDIEYWTEKLFDGSSKIEVEY